MSDFAIIARAGSRIVPIVCWFKKKIIGRIYPLFRRVFLNCVVLMFLEWNCLVQKKHTYSITTLYVQTRFRRIVGTPADFKTSGGKNSLVELCYTYIYNIYNIYIYIYIYIYYYLCIYTYVYISTRELYNMSVQMFTHICALLYMHR